MERIESLSLSKVRGGEVKGCLRENVYKVYK